jgi:hypothetical protein
VYFISMYKHRYIYIFIYLCMFIYMYIYIYVSINILIYLHIGDQKHRDLLSLFLSVKEWGQGRNGSDGEDVLLSFKYVLI